MKSLIAFDLWQWVEKNRHALLHDVTMHVADIERELKAAIERFDASLELRTCRRCGRVQPEQPPVPDQRPAVKA